MKNKMIQFTSVFLALCMLLPLAACGTEPKPAVKAADVFYALLNEGQFETPLIDDSDSAATVYTGLPEGASVTMYAGNARYADELTWIVVAQPSDLEAASNIVDKHIEEKHDQFLSYHAEEVPKIDGALIFKDDTNIILCITGDYDGAKALMDNPGTPAHTAPTQAPTVQPTQPPTEPEPTEPPTEAPTEPTEPNYPEIITEFPYRHKGDAMIVGNQAYEYYLYNESAAKSYAELVSKTGKLLEGQTNVYCMVIPTAIGIIFPDNLIEQYSGYEYQGDRLDQIYAMMDSSVIPVNIYDKLMQHRNEYLYFRTDWHWTGTAAYYGYERFCEIKGITPYTLDQRTEHIYEGYLGPLYSQDAGKDPALAETPDTVYAYDPYFKDVTMVYTDTNGNRYPWPIINDGEKLKTGSKYLVFAAGDQPFAEFTNPNVTDGSVAIIVKESFGNAMMSYYVDHYSTVYEIDYRYWEGNLVDFAKLVGAQDVIFANNIGMVRSSYLIGLMDRIIP